MLPIRYLSRIEADEFGQIFTCAVCVNVVDWQLTFYSTSLN